MLRPIRLFGIEDSGFSLRREGFESPMGYLQYTPYRFHPVEGGDINKQRGLGLGVLVILTNRTDGGASTSTGVPKWT